MDADIAAAREKLKAKFGEGSRIGGKGTVRRKAAAVTKATSADDKKLGSTLKRMGVNTIPGIEEVSIVKDDGTAIVFANPKVQANVGSNTYVVSGTAENKSAADVSSFMSGLSGLGGAGGINPAQLKMLQELMAKAGPGGLEQMLKAAGAGAGADAGGDEEVPELEGDFESASK